MGNHKFLKVCSVLPVLLVMPAMADDVTNVTVPELVNGTKTFQVLQNEVATIKSGAVVSGNAADVGGAIQLFKPKDGKAGGKLIVEDGVTFKNNTAVYDGGAIGNYGSLDITGATFDGNIAQTTDTDKGPIGGGAISLGIDSNTQTLLKGSTFSNNTSGYNGGAIGTRMTIQAGETGEENSLVISDSTFTGNKTTGITVNDTDYGIKGGNGGAISNTFATTEIKNSTFDGNVAKNYGGAIYNSKYYDAATKTVNEKTGKITTKLSETYGGKIVLSADEGKENLFENNSAKSGGAIYNDKGAAIEMSGTNTFEGNTSTHIGGAIYNEGTVTMNGVNEFVANISDNLGGAIYSYGNSKTNPARFTLSGQNTFTDNESHNGGAVYNAGNSTITLTGNNTFSGNVAITQHGGAIYNKGTMLLSGVNTFTDNAAEYYGGAIYAVNDDLIFEGKTTFEQNYAKQLGGAIYVYVGLTLDNVGFTANEAGLDGGALYFSRANTSAVSNSSFEANVANRGGAIFNYSASNKTLSVDVSDSIFAGNIAKTLGGAIYNEADMTLNDVDFVGNSAVEYGGAVYNEGTMEIVDAEFKGNTSSGWGGAVYASTGSETTIKDSEFVGNKGAAAGALAAGTTSKNMLIEDTLFQDNSADEIGAVGLFSAGTLKNVTFIRNKATSSADDSDGSGALFLGAVSTTDINGVISGSVFEGNTSNAVAGALGTRSFYLGNNKDAALDISKTMFKENTAATQGGAFNNYFYQSNKYADAVYLTDSSFVSNKADKGAAIYNHGSDSAQNKNDASLKQVAAIVLNNVSFMDNVATTSGGAIYNETGAIVRLTGKNSFSGNTAAKKANDIYNLGQLTVESGETTIGGGITGTGTLTVAKDAKLNIGTTSIEQGAIIVNGDVYADLMKSARGEFLSGKLLSDSITGDGTLNLNIASIGSYTVANENDNAKDFFDKQAKYGETYNVSFDKGVLTVTTKSVEDIAADTGLTQESAGVVSTLANSTDSKLATMSLRAQQALNAGDVAYVEQETSKANPEDKPVAQSEASSVQNQVTNLTASRMSGVVGRAGGDAEVDYGVWVQGLFNKAKMNGAFHGYTRGMAFGADALIDKVYTIGMGAAFSDTDVHVDNARDMDVESTSVFVYGQYKPSRWFINGTLNYTMSEYTENATMFGVAINPEYDVKTFGGQVMTGYDIASGLTPEIGVRYLHIEQDAYTNVLGSTIASEDIDYMTAVANMRYAFDIETDSQWTFRPEIHAGVTYDFKSDKSTLTVTVPGAAAYVVDANRLSRMGGQFGLGVTTRYHGLDISLMYDLDVHEDYTSQTGVLKFRYDF